MNRAPFCLSILLLAAACDGPTGPPGSPGTTGPPGETGDPGPVGKTGAIGRYPAAIVCEGANEVLYGIDAAGRPMCRVDQTAAPGSSGVSSLNTLGGDINLFSPDRSLTVVPNTVERRIALTVVESDSVFGASPAAGIAAADVNRWNQAHSWGDHRSAGYVHAPMVWLEQFGGVAVSGGGRSNQRHAAANVAAFNAAFKALPHGGKISVGPGIFYLNAGIDVPTNIWIQGAGWANVDAVNTQGKGGTTFRPTLGSTISEIFSTRIGTRNVRLTDFTIVGGRSGSNGPAYDATVDAAVHLLGIAHTAERLRVAYISGDGIWVGDRSVSPPPYYWIFWLRGNHVSSCGRHGLRVESSDGFVVSNYSGGHARGNISYGGGDIWMGNHFDNMKDASWAALTLENQGGVATGHVAEQVLGNYFDRNAVALRIAGTAGSPVPFRGTIANNYFRAIDVHDIHVVGVAHPVLDGFTSNKGGAAGIQKGHSLRFDSCSGSRIVRNATWGPSWTTGLDVVDPGGQAITHCVGCFQAGVAQ